MKVRASIKKRSADCKIVKRKGKLFVINKRILALSNVKDKTSGGAHLHPIVFQSVTTNSNY